MAVLILVGRQSVSPPHPLRCDLVTWQSICNGPCGYRSRVADSRVQRPNHWAIKEPERPSRLRLAGSLHYSPLFEIRAPWLGPLSTKAGSFHSQANPGYRCHQCNGPCGYRSRVADSRVQRPNHWAIKVPERPSRLRLAGSLHIKEWHRLRLVSSLAFWVVETVDGDMTSSWLVVLSQQSIDALNSYGQLLLDKDNAIRIVLFITILQNQQKIPCLSR